MQSSSHALANCSRRDRYALNRGYLPLGGPSRSRVPVLPLPSHEHHQATGSFSAGLPLIEVLGSDSGSEAGGNRAEAAALLWKRSRHDEALREDLVKAACALLALAPPVARHEGEAPALGWRRRPGRLSKCDLDPEVAAFVRERLGTMPVIKIAAEVLARFGPDRAPRKTAICRYWQRLDEERCAT